MDLNVRVYLFAYYLYGLEKIFNAHTDIYLLTLQNLMHEKKIQKLVVKFDKN